MCAESRILPSSVQYNAAGRERRAVSAPRPNPSIPAEPTPSAMGSLLPPYRLRQRTAEARPEKHPLLCTRHVPFHPSRLPFSFLLARALSPTPRTRRPTPVNRRTTGGETLRMKQKWSEQRLSISDFCPIAGLQCAARVIDKLRKKRYFLGM